MTTPENLRYSQDHAWVLVNGNNATIGITYHSQKQLGEIVYVELPKKDSIIDTYNAFGTVESIKAVIELFTPVGGEVIEVNESLQDEPAIVNEDPYGKGWMVKLKMNAPDEVKKLMTAKAYDDFCKEESAG